MSPVEQLDILEERLKGKDRDLALEIQLVTAWIKEHRKTRPTHVEAPESPARKREEYRNWRIVSCRLHQRRSELKTKQEKNQMHLRVVTRKINEVETESIEIQQLCPSHPNRVTTPSVPDRNASVP